MSEEYFTESQAASQGEASAISKLEASQGSDSNENPHYAQDEPAQNGGEVQQAQPPAPVQEEAPAQEMYEFDYQGQRHQLTAQERDYLVRHALDSYAAGRQRQEQQAQPQYQPQPQPQYQGQQADGINAQLADRIGKLESQLQQATTERQVEQITRKLEDAVSKVKLYGELKDPAHQSFFKKLVMMEQYQNPNMSPETAAAQAEQFLSGLLRDRASAYVQTKVAQAEKRVESGGTAVGTPQGPMTGKDLFNGNVLKSAMNRVKQMMNS